MSNKLENIKFILTGQMTYILKKINNTKKELILVEKQMNSYKNTIHYHTLQNYQKILENKISDLKKDFIKEFRKENKIQIMEYLQIKNLK